MDCLNHRAARTPHFVRRLRWFLVAFAFAGIVASVYAAGGVKVTPQSVRYVRAGQNADGSTRWMTHAEWSAWFERSTAAGATSAVSEVFTTTGGLSSSTIGGLARKAIRGGVYGVAVTLAVEGIIDGAGWAINELRDQVLEPGTKPQLEDKGWCAASAGGNVCAPTSDQLIPWAQKRYPPSDPSSIVRWYTIENGSTGLICALHRVGGCAVAVTTYLVTRPTAGWGDYQNVAPGTEGGPVSDEHLGDVIRQNPQLVNDLLTDPRTGRPIMTPELQQQGEQLRRDIEQREGLPTSDPLPNPNLEDDTPKDEGSPWPSFCSWATPVCDFIEWFKGPGDPDVDLPEREVQFDQDGWSSGVGGGTCPQAQEFSVELVGTTGRASFDFQPLCSFATTMRPVLIAVCALIAAFILAGLRSSGGGRS